MEAVLTGPMGRTLLGSSEVTIGCDANNSLIIADLRTAAHHARVCLDGMGYAIIDLGSEYGTIVNGRWLEPNKTQPLLPGDIIQIGNTSLTFEVFQNSAAIPTGLLGVGVGSPVGVEGTGRVGQENAPVPVPPPRTDIADQDTGRFNPLDAAQPAASAVSSKISISSLRSRLYQSQPMQPPYTSQPWVPGGSTTYPPQQQLWQQDRRRLYIALAAMLAILIVFSLISLIASRSTPDKTLDTFCNALLASNGQLAANQLSTKLQNQQGSLSSFVVANKITTCAHTPAIIKGAGATATLSITIPSNSGTANSLSKTLVTLIQDTNGIWKIDALQNQ
jgi:FHA domain